MGAGGAHQERTDPRSQGENGHPGQHLAIPRDGRDCDNLAPCDVSAPSSSKVACADILLSQKQVRDKHSQQGVVVHASDDTNATLNRRGE